MLAPSKLRSPCLHLSNTCSIRRQPHFCLWACAAHSCPKAYGRHCFVCTSARCWPHATPGACVWFSTFQAYAAHRMAQAFICRQPRRGAGSWRCKAPLAQPVGILELGSLAQCLPHSSGIHQQQDLCHAELAYHNPVWARYEQVGMCTKLSYGQAPVQQEPCVCWTGQGLPYKVCPAASCASTGILQGASARSKAELCLCLLCIGGDAECASNQVEEHECALKLTHVERVVVLQRSFHCVDAVPACIEPTTMTCIKMLMCTILTLHGVFPNEACLHKHMTISGQLSLRNKFTKKCLRCRQQASGQYHELMLVAPKTVCLPSCWLRP